MRRKYIVLIATAAVLFLLVSALLARVYSADGAEGSAVTALVQAEAGGDERALLERLKGCRVDRSCLARVSANVAELRQAGPVSILQEQPSTGFSLVGTLGTARVAWRAGSGRPVVQCVRVRRAGDVITGLRIELLALSRKIKSDADCPARF